MEDIKNKYEKQINLISQQLVEGFLDVIGENEGYKIEDYDLGRLLGHLFFILNKFEVLK